MFVVECAAIKILLQIVLIPVSKGENYVSSSTQTIEAVFEAFFDKHCKKKHFKVLWFINIKPFGIGISLTFLVSKYLYSKNLNVIPVK